LRRSGDDLEVIVDGIDTEGLEAAVERLHRRVDTDILSQSLQSIANAASQTGISMEEMSRAMSNLVGGSVLDGIDRWRFAPLIPGVEVDRDIRTQQYLFACMACGEIFLKVGQMRMAEMGSFTAQTMVFTEHKKHLEVCRNKEPEEEKAETPSPADPVRLIRFKRE